jgi:hypothetical protein
MDVVSGPQEGCGNLCSRCEAIALAATISLLLRRVTVDEEIYIGEGAGQHQGKVMSYRCLGRKPVPCGPGRAPYLKKQERDEAGDKGDRVEPEKC